MNNAFLIFDQQGRQVMKGKLTGKETEVSLGTLSKGSYTIQIEGHFKPAVIVKKQKKETLVKKSPLLYPRPGSNRHSRKNRILNPARLPVPPLGPSNSERQK